jgi:excisionase family DNA binding protein
MHDLTPLYVRLPRKEADLLDRAAFEGRTSKRELVTEAVRAHLGMERGRIEFRPAADPPAVLTLAEAADLLQVEPKAVGELAEAKELPGRKIAGEWRFARAALLAWLSHND